MQTPDFCPGFFYWITILLPLKYPNAATVALVAYLGGEFCPCRRLYALQDRVELVKLFRVRRDVDRFTLSEVLFSEPYRHCRIMLRKSPLPPPQ